MNLPLEHEEELQAGQLLLAVPMLKDPNFRRTVVLLCEHSSEGSFGLVLNRPLDLKPGELVEALEDVDADVGFGGPVQTDTLHYLHAFDLPDAEPVVDGVFWGGDFELLQALIEEMSDGDPALRFYLGYSGWDSGQLQDEVDEGAWIAVQASEQLVFRADPDSLWRAVLRSMGGTYALLANFPEDPSMN